MYQNPKTNWTTTEGPFNTDYNRIEGNIGVLANLRKYPTASGTGTAITVETGYFELEAGMQFNFIAAADNGSAATTINADEKGAISVYKPNSTTPPTFIAGKAYTVWYDGTSFFVKAGAAGDADAGDVIKNKSFSNDNDTNIVGTLELTGNALPGDVIKNSTFYNTNPKSKQTGTLELTGTADPEHVLYGYTFYKDNPKSKQTATMPNRGTVNTDISAKATEVTIAAGYHSGAGKVKISAAEQAKIIEGNIAQGKTILGQAGNFTADATAAAADVASGKTAYVNGSKITGTFNKATILPGFFFVGNGSGSTNNTSMVKIYEFNINSAGSFRVRHKLSGGIPGVVTVYSQIYKNGSPYGTLHTLSTAAGSYIEDLSFAVNDKVQLYVRTDNSLGSVNATEFMLGVQAGFNTDFIANAVI